MQFLRMPILLLLLYISSSLACADEWHYSNVARIVAVGDIHGAFVALTETLQAVDVLDSGLDWSGGKTHLVFTGDLLDRGAQSRQVMDLVMRLERQARRSGGRVHLLLGNHEVMNLVGDLRYVSDAEFAAYQDIESNRVRERWFADFLARQPDGSDEAAARSAFDALAPPGYFGHRKAFRHNGKYGKWLLGRPFMVVINDTAFVHGGLPRFVAEHGLDGVNVGLKNDLEYYVLARDRLTDQKVLSPVYRFKKIPALLKEWNEAAQIPRKAQDTALAIINLSQSPLHTPIGPTWYRGSAACSALEEDDVLADALARIDANRVVIGHTTTITRQVQQRSHGRTIEIDTGMLAQAYQGSGNALVIKDDRLRVVNQDGEITMTPLDHPLRVAHESLPLGDDELERVLANGKLVELQVEEATRRYFEVSYRGLTVFARFVGPRGVAPEVAAYKLDRMLGLGMVPVAVRRGVAGEQGALQLLPAKMVSDADLVGNKTRIEAPCSLDKQAAAMRVFDALIGNAGRAPTSMLYDTEDLLLILVDHSEAFAAATSWPGAAPLGDVVVNAEWRRALRGLDNVSLQAALGELLDERQMEALRQRRDALLDSAAGGQ